MAESTSAAPAANPSTTQSSGSTARGTGPSVRGLHVPGPSGCGPPAPNSVGSGFLEP